MKRILNAVKGDILFQFRSGFHGIYIILSLIYILALNELPDTWARVGVPFMIYSDPSVLGFFFIGGLVMLERVQGVVALMGVTPVRAYEYLLGKIISLTLISLGAGFSIAHFTGQRTNPISLFLAITLTSAMYSLIGFNVALKSRSMNRYFGKVIPMTLLIVLPMFSLVGFKYSWLFYVFPSVATAKMFMLSFYGGEPLPYGVCSIIGAAWVCVLFIMGLRAFENFGREGDLQ